MNILSKKDWECILSNKPSMVSSLIYGSSNHNLKKANDVDLFIIFEQAPSSKSSSYKNNYVFDINQVSLQDTYNKISLWDIDFTEPFLTGKTIKGSKDVEYNAKNYLLNNKPTSVAIDYLKKRSIESLLQTEQLLSQTKYELLLDKVKNNFDIKKIKDDVLNYQNSNTASPTFSMALNQLNYALSYHASAKRYEKNHGVITFSDLITNPINKSEELLVETRQYQKSSSPKKLGDFVNFYKKAESLIKR